MNIIDLAYNGAGKRVVLTDEGILSEDAVNGMAYQHLPPDSRPTVAWNRVAGPMRPSGTLDAYGREIMEPLPLDRVFCGPHGLILVLSEGRLYQRVQDSSGPGLRWRWQELTPGETTPVPVNPPAVERTEVLRVGADGKPLPPEATAPAVGSVSDTFETQKVASQQTALANLAVENAALRKVIDELTPKRKAK